MFITLKKEQIHGVRWEDFVGMGIWGKFFDQKG